MYNGSVDFDRFVLDYAETLRAVDDSVGRIVRALTDAGALEQTLIVFTSDNGFQFGEHGLIDKRTMYETSIRVPLILRGPLGASGGKRLPQMILNVDFAPDVHRDCGWRTAGLDPGPARFYPYCAIPQPRDEMPSCTNTSGSGLFPRRRPSWVFAPTVTS